MKNGTESRQRSQTAAHCAQFFLVFAAFLTMVLISNFFTGRLIRQQIHMIGEETMETTQTAFATGLREAELLLENVTHNVGESLKSGKKTQDILEYLQVACCRYGTKHRLHGLLKIYGFIRGEYLSSAVVDGADYEGYALTYSLWYTGALESAGKIHITEPCYDYETGSVRIALSQELFDENGKSYGVLAVDINPALVIDYVAERRVASGGYAVLTDRNARFVSHKDQALIGVSMERAGGDYNRLKQMLGKGPPISAERFTDADGTDSVAFFRPVSNGWHVGAVIPGNRFYSEERRMRIVTWSLGILFMLGLSFMLMWLRNRQTRFEEELSVKTSSLCVLESVLDALDILLYVTDAETGEILFVNKTLMEHFGITESVTGKYCWEVFQSGFSERCGYCSLPKILENHGEPFVWEGVNNITGRYYRNIDRMIDWPDGKKVHFCQRIDMSEIKQAQEMLLRMSAIVQSSPNFIAYWRTSGECIFINPAASKLTGFSESEFLNGHVNLIFDSQSVDYFKNEVVPMVNERGEVRFEVPYRCKDGEVRYFSVIAFKIESVENALGSIATDITYRKRIEAEKEDALKKAEEASRAKSNFLSRMSHEMRTPLNAIVGMALLAQKGHDRTEIQKCIRTISKSADQLTRIINDILDMSKINNGKLELSETAFQIKDMLKQIRVLTGSAFKKKSQIYSEEIDENVPETVVADRRKLEQVIINLLNNACKFTSEGGNIALRIRREKSTGDRCQLLVEVEDDGIGIFEEQQKRLFDAFEQADNTASREYGGTGLGLAISRSMVQMMNGKIWVRSQPGRGSTFSFTVDVGTGDLREAHGRGVKKQVPAETSNIFARKRILVVDDISINRDVLTSLLADTGVVVDCAGNGREACEKYAANDGLYDLIFMDIHMPEMDGYLATKKIRGMGSSRARTVPIIAMTADVFSRDMEKCFAAGMNDRIEKPVTADEVIEKMKQCLLKGTPD